MNGLVPPTVRRRNDSITARKQREYESKYLKS